MNSRIEDIFSELASSKGARAELYKEFHRTPELSGHEYLTAARIGENLRALGLTPVWVGETGLVVTLENGEGPVVAMRADIDGLPVTEASGKDYASTTTTVNDEGETVGVMHACGHDVHIVSLLGAIKALHARRDSWSGTFVGLFQPAEETASGAQAMVDAGLVHLMPKPDVFLGQHVMPMLPLGAVGVYPGVCMAAASSIRITIHGKGTHGSMPEVGVDPIVMAAAIILRLQTIVSREIRPADMGVVTIGAIRSGTKSNVIPDTVTMLLNTRSYDADVEKHLHSAIERIVRAECAASRAPRDPEFEYYDGVPLTVNDEAVTAKIQSSFTDYFGDNHVPVGPTAGSEDFSVLPDAFGVPYSYWVIGGFDDPSTAPGNHSAEFAPEIESVDVGAEAIIAAAAPWLIR